METKVIFLVLLITASSLATSSIPIYDEQSFIDPEEQYRIIGHPPFLSQQPPEINPPRGFFNQLPQEHNPPRGFFNQLPHEHNPPRGFFNPLPPERIITDGINVNDNTKISENVRPIVKLDSEYWKNRRQPGVKGVATHPDGSTSFVGATTHGIGKRAADNLKEQESKVTPVIKEVEAEGRIDSDATGKRLTPFDLKYSSSYLYGYPFSRFFHPSQPDYVPENERYKYRPYFSYGHYPYYNGYRPHYTGYQHPFYNSYPYAYGRPHHPYSLYNTRYYDWGPEVSDETTKKVLATKEVSVHPKGGVSYVSRRVHGAG